MPTYPPTTIGHFKTPSEPEPPQYETLADVPPYVAVRRRSAGGDDPGFAYWTSERGVIVCACLRDPSRVFPSLFKHPSSIRVHSVLGPITAIQFGGEVSSD